MAELFAAKCPCGHSLTALGLGRDDGKTQEIVSIHPIKCLHPFMLLGTKLRKVNGRWQEIRAENK